MAKVYFSVARINTGNYKRVLPVSFKKFLVFFLLLLRRETTKIKFCQILSIKKKRLFTLFYVKKLFTFFFGKSVFLLQLT